MYVCVCVCKSVHAFVRACVLACVYERHRVCICVHMCWCTCERKSQREVASVCKRQ